MLEPAQRARASSHGSVHTRSTHTDDRYLASVQYKVTSAFPGKCWLLNARLSRLQGAIRGKTNDLGAMRHARERTAKALRAFQERDAKRLEAGTPASITKAEEKAREEDIAAAFAMKKSLEGSDRGMDAVARAAAKLTAEYAERKKAFLDWKRQNFDNVSPEKVWRIGIIWVGIINTPVRCSRFCCQMFRCRCDIEDLRGASLTVVPIQNHQEAPYSLIL